MNPTHNPQHRLVFASTKEMLSFAEEYPATLKTHWRDYYVANSLNNIARLTGQNKELAKLNIEYIIKNDMSCKDFLCAHFKPIPCPHLTFSVNLSFATFVASVDKPHSALEVKQKHTDTHREIFCIENAWKYEQDAIYIHMVKYIADSVSPTIDKLREQAYENEGVAIDDESKFHIIYEQILPAIKFSYMRYVAEHAARGLLNKELFD